ncbi:hypothetical protein GCM10011511_44510 [Puia dinghuensis]|uniref:T9SS C-terminal target domain-containing protein n=2 Tax=Puia dinghuensis TaxID=1792502 RepID=A0A8J2XTA8_9BACT|nr:hypothetical protein GCM10011511_44510 [Puia dinghuensis]
MIDLVWTTSAADDYRYFEVQRSTDGSTFADIGRVDGSGPAGDTGSFTYSDEADIANTNFYRLKLFTDDDHYTYSSIIAIQPQVTSGLRFFFDADRKELQVTVQQSSRAAIVGASGQLLKTLTLVAGRNSVSMSDVAPGVYFLRDEGGNTTRRFVVFK